MISVEITKYQQSILETVYKKTYTLCTGPRRCGTTFAFNLVIEDFLNRGEGNFLIVVMGFVTDYVPTFRKANKPPKKQSKYVVVEYSGDYSPLIPTKGNYYDEILIVADNFCKGGFDQEDLHNHLWSVSGQEPLWIVFNNPTDIWEVDGWWGKQGWLDFGGNRTACGVKVSDDVSWVDGGRYE